MKKKIIIIFLLIFIVLAAAFWFTKDEPKVVPASLTSTQWVWLYTELQDGKVVSAPQGERFILSLGINGSVTSSTDCNTISGGYVKDGEVLSFTPFIATKMYCEGSFESQYTQQLSLTNSHVIEGQVLKLILNRDFGVMTFVKR